MIRGVEDADKRHWLRVSHQMALLYNINRGKGQAMSYEDFYPYSKEREYVEPTKITPTLINELTAMQLAMRTT